MSQGKVFLKGELERMVSRISIRKMSHMSIQPQLMLKDNAGKQISFQSLSNRSLDTKSDQR